MIAQPIHVAILDDDPSVRTALARLLKSAGMTVDAFGTSDHLFEFIALNNPDCLLLDFQMPRMSGLDVLKQLRQQHIHIPTIMITAHDDKGIREACLNAGAVAFLSKTLAPERLIQTIDEVFRSSQSGERSSFGLSRHQSSGPSAQSRCFALRYSPPLTGKITRKIVP